MALSQFVSAESHEQKGESVKNSRFEFFEKNPAPLHWSTVFVIVKQFGCSHLCRHIFGANTKGLLKEI